MRKGLTIFIVLVFVLGLVAVAIFMRSNVMQGQVIVGDSVGVIVKNLDTVWGIDFLPDGRMIFTERGGRVSVYDFESGDVDVVGKIDVYEVSESGLHGVAVDLEFEDNGFVYVYYTHELANRVSRFVFEDGELGDEIVLLDGIPNARFHDGGRVKFGPDGLLYITTGDATTPSSAQDLDSLAGKILRMNKDGSVPEDNPFGNYVYSYGHRNPQGIVWDDNGNMYESEHGPSRNDEVNVIVRGGNYGWPIVQCDVQSEEYINPISCYSDFTLAPGGIAYYDNALYVAGLRGAQVRKLVLDEGVVISEEEFVSDLGRVREVVEHDEMLYIGTSNKDGRGIPRIGDDKIIGFNLGKDK